MEKYFLVLVLLFATALSFSVEEGENKAEVVEEQVAANEEEQSRSLSPGQECDGNKDDCQCYGKWHKCSCPWFWPLRSGKCTCEKGYKYTCIKKLSCSNKGEWETDRSEEAARSPC